MKILHCYSTHFIFHQTYCTSSLSFYLAVSIFAYSFTNLHIGMHTAIILILYLLPNNPFFSLFITRMVAKNILHAYYVAKLRTFLLDITNFLSITNSLSAFFIAALQCDIIFCHVCSIRLLLQSLKNHFLQQYTFHHSFCMRKYRNICTTH